MLELVHGAGTLAAAGHCSGFLVPDDGNPAGHLASRTAEPGSGVHSQFVKELLNFRVAQHQVLKVLGNICENFMI
jgi:hypothetical protein